MPLFQNESLWKTCHMKMSLSLIWMKYIFIRIVSHEDSFGHRQKATRTWPWYDCDITGRPKSANGEKKLNVPNKYNLTKRREVFEKNKFFLLRPRPHVSGYFLIRNFFFPDSNIFPSARSVFKSSLPVYTHAMVSGFTLVPKAPLH